MAGFGRRLRLGIETLEDRWLPSQVQPFFEWHRLTLPGSGPSTAVASIRDSASSAATGLTASDLRKLYSVRGDGAGVTVAIITAYDQPNLASDLAAFSRANGLPNAPLLTKRNQTGGSVLPAAAAKNGWGVETTIDVELLHAIAPRANILVFEANSNSTADLYEAVDTARKTPGVSVVSMSWGGLESASDVSNEGHFVTPAGHVPVTFLAASGDLGATGVNYPASSPRVIAVGGTSLATATETGWSGSGGGLSRVFASPAYQQALHQSTRAVPDLSFNADPASGVSIYDSYDNPKNAPWQTIGGTSAAAPIAAGLFAFVNQARDAQGISSIDGVQSSLPTIYAASPAVFNDITIGNNGTAATPGFDTVTGLGRPLVGAFVSTLATSSLTIALPLATAAATSGDANFVTPFAFSNWSAIGPAINGVVSGAGPLASATVINFGTTVYSGPLNVVNTINRIKANGTPLDSNDGAVYHNNNGLLPNGTWYEFVVSPSSGTDRNFSGVSSPGPMRLLLNTTSDLYFTGDHYSSFQLVSSQKPTVSSFTASPASVLAGSTITLTATGVTEVGGTISNVKFYRETNATAGLQTAADTLLGTGTKNGTTYSFNTSTTGFAVGNYTYYAVATDTAATSVTFSTPLAIGSAATGSTLLAWDVNGQVDFGIQNLGATALATGISNTLGLTRGNGVEIAGTAATGDWGGTGWGTTAALGISDGAFATFGFTVAAGKTASLSAIDLHYRRSGSGPSDGQWHYQINGGAWTLIADVPSAFTSTSTSGAAMPTLNLAAVSSLQNLAAGTAVTFRVTPYLSTNTGGTWYVDDGTGNDLTISGTVANAATVASLTVNGGDPQRARLLSVAVNFSATVDASTLSGISFTRTTATAAGTVGTIVNTSNGLILSPSTGNVSSVTLTFSNIINTGVENASLADGLWQLSVPTLSYASPLNDTNLRRLYADANRDGTVNGSDLLSFGNAFNSATVAFDFNNDGTINGADLLTFGNHFGQSV